MMLEEVKRYDPYTDKFIKNTTTNRIEVGTDGSLNNLSILNSFGLYAKNLEELDRCDYIDKSVKLYTEDEVIGMFTELKAEIEELDPNYECNTYYAAIRDCSNLTQQKINKLKEGA